MTSDLAALERARNYSNQKIETLRSRLSSAITNSRISIVTVGSFARREASVQSDLDFFVLTDIDSTTPAQEIEILRDQIREENIKMPSPDGAFDSEVAKRDEMIHNIGGMNDETKKLTRRLLFLLEGDWLYNKSLFEDLFEQFICVYVRETITENQLCRFLLNDLIRYYRTICVDFEYKTYEDGKPWGDRNIKLMFSRKLLYFSGILVVAETAQNNWQTKREILRRYLRITPLERLRQICGSKSEKALETYNEFLKRLSSDATRAMLKATPEIRKDQSVEFRNFKNLGHHFTWELSQLLAQTYDSSHPIHNAIKF